MRTYALAAVVHILNSSVSMPAWAPLLSTVGVLVQVRAQAASVGQAERGATLPGTFESFSSPTVCAPSLS